MRSANLFRRTRFCLFCHGSLAGTRLTAATPGQAPILRSARINGWRRRSSRRKRVISTCCPSLGTHVVRSRPIRVHGVALPVIITQGALRCRRFRAGAVLHRDFPRSPSDGLRGPVVEPLPSRFNLSGIDVSLWRRITYRSVVRRPRCAPVITRWTAARESRNSRAMAAGLRPASQAARISRSCPGVTPPPGPTRPAVFDRPFPAPAGSACRLSPGEPSGTARPRRRASPTAASSSRSRASSSSRRSDRPRSAGRARPAFPDGRAGAGAGARRRLLRLPGFSVIARLRAPRPRRPFTVSGAGGRRGHRYGFSSFGERHSE